MFCSNCRAQLPDGSRFCSECGVEIGATFSSTPPVSVQPRTWASPRALSNWGQISFYSMSTIHKIYFISAWVVAVAALLTVILMPIGRADMDSPGLMIFATICQLIFLGLTGVFTLLSLSGWFKNSLALFILAWIVAGLALLTLIILPISYGDLYGVPGTVIAGDVFFIIFLGVSCTILLLHQSQWFTKDEQVLSGSPQHDGDYLSAPLVDIRCPNCGSETVIKTATSGENVGRRFHVCSRYPTCKGKVPLAGLDEFAT